jgi:4a-hydroxytetrahydrobiopterin dehydratase
MSELKNEKCVPCEGGDVEALSESDAKSMINDETPEWKLIDDSKKISREFEFKNFVKALEFVNKVGEIAEEQGHHPDIELGWGYANIKIQTHAIGGLHKNDFILASKIDEIY